MIFKQLKKKFNNWFGTKAQNVTNSSKLKKSTSSLKVFCKSLQKHCQFISDDSLRLIEEQFIQNDFGPEVAKALSEQILLEIKHHQVKDTNLITEIILDKLLTYYIGDKIIDLRLQFKHQRLNVMLITGVNGVGKTTTIAKLAHHYKQQGYKILLIAGDTFRSGAVEQLTNWAQKLNIDIFKPDINQKAPSAVIYQGLTTAKLGDYNLVICDTSGCLENKQNLMNQLIKINQVIKKISDGPHESLLVLDATIGQSGLRQAEVFKEALNLTGLILTKTDSTSKGGIIFAIKEMLNLPVKYIGTGEQLEDLSEFHLIDFVSDIINLFE